VTDSTPDPDPDPDTGAAPSSSPSVPSVVAVGSAVLDRYYRLSNLPDPDGGAFVREAREGYGGVAANVACGLTRLDRSAGLIGRLGTDHGDALAADLREWGVDVARTRSGDEPSTYSMVFRGPGGERMLVTGGESARALRLRGDDWPYMRGARAVFTCGYVPDRAVEPVVAARAEGELPPLVFDLSGPLPELEDRGVRPGTVDAAVAAGDLFVAGEVALDSYLDAHGVHAAPREAARWLRERGADRVALTRGAGGAVLADGDGIVDVPAYDVDVVDATGAGDAFVAGLIDAWLLDGRPAAEAGRHAAAAAALNCEADGARTGLPTRTALESFRAERD